MPKLEIVYFDAGGGHAAAARALQGVLRTEAPDWEVSPVNLQELLDEVDFVRRVTGVRLQDGYNLLLARDWTWGFSFWVRVLRATIALRGGAIGKRIEAHFAATRPDWVVSCIPHFNPYLLAALRATRPGAKLGVLITDFADTAPGFWLNAVADCVFCGTERAVAQARAAGYPEGDIVATSGMALRPGFYAAAERRGDAEGGRDGQRQRLGLEAGLPTALVLLGGAGSSRMLDIAARLEPLAGKLQAIYLCGHNRAVAERLRRLPHRARRRVEGHTQEVPFFMRLCDFAIGKPGPGAIAEAVCLGLPVAVVSDRRTMPQERYNALWLHETRLGVALRHWRELPGALEEFLRPGVLTAYRARAAQRSNRALFEIAAELRRRVDHSKAAAPQ